MGVSLVSQWEYRWELRLAYAKNRGLAPDGLGSLYDFKGNLWRVDGVFDTFCYTNINEQAEPFLLVSQASFGRKNQGAQLEAVGASNKIAWHEFFRLLGETVPLSS